MDVTDDEGVVSCHHGNVSTTSGQSDYPELALFYMWYRQYHGYAAVTVCAVGIAANLANIAVLTRPSMRSPINCLLTGLAVSDALTMASYLPFAVMFYVAYGVQMSVKRNGLAAARFLLFYARFSVVVHTAAIWLAVLIASFRYVIIRYPQSGVVWCNLRRAQLAVILVFFSSVLVCIPNYMTITIRPRVVTPSSTPLELSTTCSSNHTANSTRQAVLWTVLFKLDSEVDQLIHSLNFWIQALAVRLGPCIMLVVLCALLVRTMRQADARLKHMDKRPTLSRQKRQRATNRTTRMLLIIVALFLLTELPQGVVSVLGGVSSRFTVGVYLNLGDLFDITVLVNSAVNFALYCTMSRQFRQTFVALFCSGCRRRRHCPTQRRV